LLLELGLEHASEQPTEKSFPGMAPVVSGDAINQGVRESYLVKPASRAVPIKQFAVAMPAS
jgi:hypothetical protein